MQAARKGRLGILAAVLASAWMLLATGSHAQDESSCNVVKGYNTSYLALCGDRLRSFSLRLWDARRPIEGLGYAPFQFKCGLPPMCDGEPDIYGWFIDGRAWRNTKQDEPAVLELLQRGLALPAFRPTPVCDVFDVKVADLAARAVCYYIPEAGFSVIVVVAAEEEAGFVLMFQDRTQDWATLRDNALEKLPRFEFLRASGDPALLRWLQ
jgi:hypothetical protein